MKYGLPYKGSKNKLAERICSLFPVKKHFYDLFCGGCAITHRMLELNQFETYTINDINKQCTDLFFNAIHGKYRNERRWISRKLFFKLKNKDPYVAFCWSFGNNNRGYMYSKIIEPYKQALHYAVVFDKWKLLYKLCPEVAQDAENSVKDLRNISKRRLTAQRQIVTTLKRLNDVKLIQENPLYKNEKLQSLECLERLQSLQRLQSLERFNKSYEKIDIKPDSVIYCDIPYRNTDGYDGTSATKNTMNYDDFYKWCAKQKELVFISSYEMPDDFICIASYEHRCTLNDKANNAVIEKVFIPKHQYSEYMRLINHTETKDKQINLFEGIA